VYTFSAKLTGFFTTVRPKAVMTKALKLNCMSCLLSVLYEPSNEVVTGPSKLTRLRVLFFTFISLNSLTGMYQNSVEPLVEANTCRRHADVLHGFHGCKMHCRCSKAALTEMLIWSGTDV